MILRSTLFAVPFVLLAACGGPETGQANNAQANISNDSRPEMNNGMVLLTLSKDQLLAIQHERHEGMEAIGKATKAAGRELQGSAPDVAVVRQSATRINALARKASGWFPEGTGPELANTGAKPEIWKNQKDFAIKLHNFQMAAAQFNAAANGSDQSAIKAKFAAMGGTCKACHDTYRAEMHH